ncbi:MAG TPA: M20/M25/M40 family metallo-hydrolase [Polyangiaceae bacterium]|nr:M20/M25/M40 family metallo-hydrolase [Polyangiaceae bacterium]
MSHSPAVRYLRDYVAIPSINPMGRTDIDAGWTGEERYACCVKAQLERLGVDGVVVGSGTRRSVVGEVRRAGLSETLLVASHLDTVPVDNMAIDPFDPALRDGRLYGRGSCDTKAGMAALMAALERVLARGSLARNLVLVGEADEESSGSVGVADVLAHLGGSRIDWAIATEPTELRLVNAHKGTAVVRVEARGRACHSSEPSRGRNAIVVLAQAIQALEQLGAELARRSHPGLGPATLSIGLVGGGQAPNIVPDRAWLAMDRRTLPGDTSESLGAEIERALSAAGVSEVKLLDVRIGKEPLFTEPAQLAVQRCQRALKRAGCDPEPCSVAFGTDAGQLAQAGIPSVVLGPGSIRRAHTESEYVELDQLERMVGVFEQILEGA